jgi:CubicO group peptidase (beta-lactamase class C family)
MTRIIFAIILSVLFSACRPSESSNSKADDLESIVGEFERQLQKDLKDDGLEGSISAAIVKGDKIVWSKAFGYADKEKTILADTGTIYRTGSISNLLLPFL